MVFIKSQAQQAVNAAAADSARCWRQWAKEACQGSAGAAHGFSKVGIDDGEVGGQAGPELLAGQANGSMVAAVVGHAQSQCQASGRPGGLERAIAKTFTRRGRRGLQNTQEPSRTGSRLHQPKDVLQLPVELRVRFIDLLMAFEVCAGLT